MLRYISAKPFFYLITIFQFIITEYKFYGIAVAFGFAVAKFRVLSYIITKN